MLKPFTKKHRYCPWDTRKGQLNRMLLDKQAPQDLNVEIVKRATQVEQCWISILANVHQIKQDCSVNSLLRAGVQEGDGASSHITSKETIQGLLLLPPPPGIQPTKEIKSVKEVPNAHCVLLGHKYALKKTCLSCDASSFDETYASPGHKGKKLWFFTQRR